ncbi:citron rho-interacting kinase-like isoform X2 [Mya arenaria]|uniref:citron rho-interacting kinase-like isoform X2 n=1 Tax=Mya arenaria TaxID=6604 RepID=UPI0022E23D04|nr:citron rho-interacting kinase-like isoform X2 [Mya arenaria]
MSVTDESIEARIAVLDELAQCHTDCYDDSGKISTSLLSREGLTDALLTLYEECCRYRLLTNKHVAAFVAKYGKTIDELRKLRILVSDFEVKDIIGRGHFGDVQVVRDKHTETVYAMKTLRKHETLSQPEITFFEEERDIMAKATSPWITKLHYAFQDSLALYLIMEFHAGGDLLSLLSRHDDIFEEKMARFYLAEIVLASNDLHKMGYVHRDLKPENVLIDCTGHIKLADFGSAAKLSAAGTVSSKMPVGTPDYVSPELLNAMNSDTVNTYGREVDWWSLGVCMYEMLFGKTPFTDESGSMVATYSNIMNYKACLKYPSSPFISSEAKSLMGGLLQDTNKRLDYAAIRKHPFFKLTNWDRIRTETPPFVPQLQGLDDTSNFEEFEKIKSPPLFDDHKNEKEFSGKDLPFVGFTYVEKLNSNDKSKSSLSAKTDKLDLSVRQSIGGVRQSIGGDVSTSIRELQRLRDKCKLLEESECTLRSSVDHLKFELGDREDMVDKLTRESQTYQMDLETYIAKSNRLSKQIEVMIEERASMEVMLGKIKCMNSEAELIEGDLHKMQMEELEDIVGQLQEEKNALTRRLSQRDQQIATYREQLEIAQKQASKLQFRMDKERRKSSDLQRRDLALLESQDERWKGELEDKTHEIHELYKRISELEELIEAYEGQEKEFMEREQALRQKLSSQADSGTDNLDIRVRVTTSPNKDSRVSERIKELEGIVDKQEHDYEVWLEREHEYKDTIEKLKEELEARSEKARLSSEVRETMATQVHMYKEEVHSQREIIKELRENVQLVLSENTPNNTERKSALEKQIKGLEEQIECYRDDKRHLMSEVSRFREESGDRQFKIAELERTTSRQSCKIERLERQLEKSREKEIDLRLKRRELTDIRIKIAEERIADVEKEKFKVERQLKDITKQLDELKDKQTDLSDKAMSTTSKVMVENLELKTKMDDVNRNVEKMEKQISKCERHIGELEEDIAAKNKELAHLKTVRTEKQELERKVMDLEFDLKQKEKKVLETSEKEQQVTKLEREKQNFETKIKSMENEIQEIKCKERSVTMRRSKMEDVEDLKQEKRFLESKVSNLQRQVENADQKTLKLEKELGSAKEAAEKVKVLEAEISILKKEQSRLQDELQSERVTHEKQLKSQAMSRRDAQIAEDNLDKEKEKNDSVRSRLQKELHESNLALSEARSLLSATQRQEKATRDTLEGDIRELRQRIFLLEKEKGLNEDNNKKEEAEKAAAQCEALEKRVKEAESRVGASQREKTAGLMERQLLKDSLAQKEHQCQLEAQKADKYKSICTELEAQIRDLEALTGEFEEREAQWKRERTTYEKAVEERENDLEGANQRLNVLKQFRQNSAEMAAGVKDQLEKARLKHQADIDTLKRQMADINKETQRQQLRVSDLESQNSKLHSLVDQQKAVLTASDEENRRLKEEISKVLTENQETKRSNLKLRQNLEEAVDKLELIFGEKIDLENFTEALQGLHFLEKYRFESTIDQQMKLIDYLQELWQDSMANKKKKGGKFFAKSGGKDAMGTLPVMGDLQTILDNELKKSRQLQEQLDRLRAENYKQANELLKLKGTLREKMVADSTNMMTPNIKAQVQVLIRTPAPHQTSGKPLLTPSVKKSHQALALSSAPTPQRIQHKIPHRFVTGLNTRATKCGVCLGSVPFVKQASKCQECSMVCHVKCSNIAQPTCGLPTEYVRHFTSMMDKGPTQLPRNTVGSPVEGGEEGISMTGWLKVPRSSKQPGWERRYAKMEGNILLLFYEDNDANPCDTFDLVPPETDVTVHSAVSAAELPSLANSDLPYVFRLEHEPLTTCWPGRVLYLMAPGFPEKQQWVASLEAAIKHLQKGDKVKRSKMEMTTLLDLSGDQRLELNCSLLLSKQLTLLGADEGLFAVNVTRDPPVLTKLNTFESVHHLKFIPQLSLIVLIMGKDRRILTIDKKLIQLRLGQSSGEETQPVHHNVVSDVVGCTVFDVGMCGDAVYMVVGMTEKILVMKYNPELRQFCVRKELSSMEPCSCVIVVEGFAIVGTDRFYKINLDHPSLLEFVDKKDSSLAFAAFGAATHHSYPLAVVQVSPEGLPLEFLLCFHEFGVYVDNKGRRSRPADMKWSCLPLSLAYKEPFLYVTYFTSVQAITVPASKQEIRGKQTSVDLVGPRYLGVALEPCTVFVGSSNGVTTQMLSLRGKDGTIELPMGKENRLGIRSAKKGDSSKSQTYNVNKYKSPRLCRRLSLTSIDSNSSVSSSSTVSSYSSVQTEL